MRGPHNIWRLIRTGATLERTGALSVVFDALEVPRQLKIAARVLAWPFRWVGRAGDPSLPPVTRALTAMGPAYIKFGQILSTRPDVVGTALADQLQLLQDRLPPFSKAQALKAVEAELQRPADELFTEFSEPVAAASIAQVHAAKLAGSDKKVAIKVLRPGIERAVRKDVDAFYLIAWCVEAFLPKTRRLKPKDVVAHFEGVIEGELDLRLEASAASEFAANTGGDDGFRVPEVNWGLSGRRVMTLDWVDGTALSDIEQIDQIGHDKVQLSERVLRLFLSHALRDGYFHADMHQGNLKVHQDGSIIALDFGIMGHIDEYTRRIYAEILYGFIRRDYHRVAEVHFEAGYVPADQDVDEFARALRAVGEPIFGMDATRISMGRLLTYLFEVTERFGMQTRTELILLQRTMVVVEGVSRSLNPHINIWEVARPVVESYIRSNVGPRAVLNDLGKTARVLARLSPQLPELVEALITANNRPPPDPAPSRLAVATLWGGLGVVVGAGLLLLLS